MRHENSLQLLENYIKGVETSLQWKTGYTSLQAWKACAFFLFILLNQKQPASRALAAAKEFLQRRSEYCPSNITPKAYWKYVAEIDVSQKHFFKFIKGSSCTGMYGSFNNNFIAWLKVNAEKIANEYGRVENIWHRDLPDDDEAKLKTVRKRFYEFRGIGPELAHVAVFTLIKQHGYAHGRDSWVFLKESFSANFAHVVQRVFFGETCKTTFDNKSSSLIHKCLNENPNMILALYQISQEHCLYSNQRCSNCPINKICSYYREHFIF